MNINRLELIRQIIGRRAMKTSEIILELEKEGFEVSAKTVQRDIKHLEEIYDIERSNSGIRLGREISTERKVLRKFSKRLLLNKEINANRSNGHILSSRPLMQNLDELILCLRAIEENRILTFKYRNQHKGENKSRQVYPLKLKEDQGRWYIAGVEMNGDLLVKYFGIDRLSKTKIGDQYSKNLNKNPEVIMQLENLTKRLGVSYPIFKDDKPERIELWVSDFLLPYWKETPVHESQKITSYRKNGYTKVHLNLIPNIDLIKLIISQLGDVKLIGPQRLKNHIRESYGNFMETILSDK